MLKITYKDKESINKYYKELLINLKNVLLQQEQNILKIISIIMKNIREGKFSVNETFTINTKYDYIMLPLEISNGTHVTLGIACCRHVNTFLYDILKELGEEASFIYIHVDENGEWHKVEPSKSNHIAVKLKLSEKEYICDATINFVGEIKNTDIIEQKITYDNVLENFKTQNIEEISKILKKYYIYREKRITSIYDY